MKRHLLRFLPYFALPLLLAACQKEPDLGINNFTNQPTAQEFIDLYVDQKIIFQYGSLNEDGRIEQGWIIDRTGKVSNVAFDASGWSNAGEECSLNEMGRLENAIQEEIGTVDLDELVAHYKLINAASLSNPFYEEVRGADADVFYAYAKRNVNAYNNYGGSCSSDHQRMAPYYRQVLLRREGATTVDNDSEQGKAILQWLQQVQQEVGGR